MRVACAKDKQLGADAAEHEGAAVIVALIDYRAGNLTSVRKALAVARRRDPDARDARRSRSVPTRSSCQASATSTQPRRSTRAWRDAIRAAARRRHAAARHLPRPAVAVRGQRRGAGLPGLGVLEGRCASARSRGGRLDEAHRVRLKVPHVGWNALKQTGRPSRMLAGVAGRGAGLLHALVRRARHDARVAVTEHGERVRQRRRARPGVRRAVPPGEERRRRAADAAQFPRRDRRGRGQEGRDRSPSGPRGCACGQRTRRRRVPASGRRGPLMLSKRIIACLDVRDGSVVKGVNFEGLRNAGDPAELARRYNVEGIDELVILDVTATLEERRALARTRSPTVAPRAVHPTGGGRRHRVRGGRRRGRRGRRRQGEHQQRRGRRPRAHHRLARAIRQPGRHRRHRRQARGRRLRACTSAAATTPTGRDAVEWAREAADRGAGEIC